jgi:hypothetical protein
MSPMADVLCGHLPPWVRHMATFLRPDAPSGPQGLHALSVVRLAG